MRLYSKPELPWILVKLAACAELKPTRSAIAGFLSSGFLALWFQGKCKLLLLKLVVFTAREQYSADSHKKFWSTFYWFAISAVYYESYCRVPRSLFFDLAAESRLFTDQLPSRSDRSFSASFRSTIKSTNNGHWSASLKSDWMRKSILSRSHALRNLSIQCALSVLRVKQRIIWNYRIRKHERVSLKVSGTRCEHDGKQIFSKRIEAKFVVFGIIEGSEGCLTHMLLCASSWLGRQSIWAESAKHQLGSAH